MHGSTLLSVKTLERPMHSQKRDWKKYNKQLVNRGKINFWVKPEVFKEWKAEKKKKNGPPFVYGDKIIKAMSYIRFKFHLSLRETEGFFLSLVMMMNILHKVPCYTQLCRRMKTLSLPKELLERKKVTDIVLDTTGLKAYGEGEWRAEKYGGKKSWKKLHLVLDAGSGKLTLAEVTQEHVHDTTYLEQALERTNRRKGKVLIDGIADSVRCYRMAEKHNKHLLTPPKKGAVLRKEPGYEKRNEAVKIVRGLGGDLLAKSLWGKLVGYNHRVVIESMMSRWKRLYGGNLKSHCGIRQRVEVTIKALMINAMIDAYAA
jgi:Transposase DDE domain